MALFILPTYTCFNSSIRADVPANQETSYRYYLNHINLQTLSYWRMDRHPLSQLITEFTYAIGFAGLELDTQANFHLTTNFHHPPPPNQRQQGQSQQQLFGRITQDCSSWSAKQCYILGQMLKNDLVRKGTQLLYVDMCLSRMKALKVQVGFKQARIMAAEQFSRLEVAQQLKYMVYYLREQLGYGSSSHPNRNTPDHKLGQNYPHDLKNPKLFQNGFYFEGLNSTMLAQSLKNNGGESYLSKSTHHEQPQPDLKYKNDIYKSSLASRTTEKQQHSKAEDPKDKIEFQTLKSLFKKLQNNP